MLKMREPANQQLSEPTQPRAQKRRSLVRRFIMFPLTRLLVAGVVFTIIATALAVVGVAIVAVIYLLSGTDSIDVDLELPTKGISAVAGIITLVLIAKVTEHRSLARVGLERRSSLRHTVVGLGIGVGEALLFVLLLTLGFVLGVIDPAVFDPPSFLSDLSDVLANLAPLTLSQLFVFTCFVAVSEEIIFRGFLFRILEEELGSWLALVISALVFGLAHLANFDNPTLLDITPQIMAGVVLGAAYMLTRKLWLSIGIHWGWDFMIFALGLDAGDALSTVVLIVLPHLILGIVLLALVLKRRQIRTPWWMQRKKPTHEKPSIKEDAPSLTEKAVDEIAAL